VQPPHAAGALEFRYQVVRLWETPVEPILEGGLGTLPLAPLARVSPGELPQVIRRMEERLAREAEQAEAALLWTSTYILMGLRYPPELAARLLEGVRAMKESATYQAILAEGREEGREEGRAEGSALEARRILLTLGTKRFGEPAPPVRAALEAERGIERLEELVRRVVDVSSWEELLG
jgi:predicted transposase YdaD